MYVYSLFSPTTSNYYDDILKMRAEGKIAKWAGLTVEDVGKSRFATAVVTPDGATMIAEWNNHGWDNRELNIVPINPLNVLHCDAIKVACAKPEEFKNSRGVCHLVFCTNKYPEFRETAKLLHIDID